MSLLEKPAEGLDERSRRLSMHPMARILDDLDRGRRKEPSDLGAVLRQNILRPSTGNEQGRSGKGVSERDVGETEDVGEMLFERIEIDAPGETSGRRDQVLQ